jgi:hypothetical protein
LALQLVLLQLRITVPLYRHWLCTFLQMDVVILAARWWQTRGLGEKVCKLLQQAIQERLRLQLPARC